MVYIALSIQAASEHVTSGWVMCVGAAVLCEKTGQPLLPTRRFCIPPDKQHTRTYNPTYIPETSLIPRKYRKYVEERAYTQYWHDREELFVALVEDLRTAPSVTSDAAWLNFATYLSRLHQDYPDAIFVTNCPEFAIGRIESRLAETESVLSLKTAPFESGMRSYFNQSAGETRHNLIDITTLRRFLGERGRKITTETNKTVPLTGYPENDAHHIALWAFNAHQENDDFEMSA